MKLLTLLMSLGLVATVPAYMNANAVDEANQTSVPQYRYEWNMNDRQEESDTTESNENVDNRYRFEDCDGTGRYHEEHMQDGYGHHHNNRERGNGMRNNRQENRQSRYGNCHGN